VEEGCRGSIGVRETGYKKDSISHSLLSRDEGAMSQGVLSLWRLKKASKGIPEPLERNTALLTP
jgi:hypothetical protein